MKWTHLHQVIFKTLVNCIDCFIDLELLTTEERDKMLEKLQERIDKKYL